MRNILTEDLVILTLNKIWDCDIPFGWVPISGNRPVPDTEIYQVEYFRDNLSDIKNLISSLYNITDIYEIQEGGLVTTKNVHDCIFCYDGLEYMYTDNDFRFVIYYSHESSVTVGGKELIAAIHKLWPDYKNHFWTTAFYE